jgi:hypothetical protein
LINQAQEVTRVIKDVSHQFLNLLKVVIRLIFGLTEAKAIGSSVFKENDKTWAVWLWPGNRQ